MGKKILSFGLILIGGALSALGSEYIHKYVFEDGMDAVKKKLPCKDEEKEGSDSE
jgi:hypothetical protein